MVAAGRSHSLPHTMTVSLCDQLSLTHTSFVVGRFSGHSTISTVILLKPIVLGRFPKISLRVLTKAAFPSQTVWRETITTQNNHKHPHVQ